MKFFDSKYRLFGLINLIDLVVILAVLVGAFAVYRVLAPRSAATKGASGSDITFEMMCPSVRLVTADQIHIGDAVTKLTSGKAFGTVTAVRVVPSPGEAWDSTLHKILPYQSTFVSDVIISAKAKGQVTANGVAIGDITIHSNQPVPMTTSTFECDTAYIVNVKINGRP